MASVALRIFIYKSKAFFDRTLVALASNEEEAHRMLDEKHREMQIRVGRAEDEIRDIEEWDIWELEQLDESRVVEVGE